MGGLCSSSISTDVRHRAASQSRPESKSSNSRDVSSVGNDAIGSDSKATIVIPSSPATEVKLDPKDFMAIKLTDQTLIREPGTIRGQQFVIEDCKNCDIMLLDHSAAITIDDCDACRIYVGPCESSVFIRNCKNCHIIVACQQLRLRDCNACDILVAVCAGQPVIEASRNIRFGCFNFSYFSLRAQFEAASLSPWDSEWSNIHDFHHSADETHWTYLSPETRASEFLRPLASLGSSTVETDDWVVPVTHGTRPRPVTNGITSIVLVYQPYHTIAYDLVDRLRPQLSSSGTLLLLRTRRWQSTPKKQAAGTVSGAVQLAGKDKTILANLARGPTIGLEFYGATQADLDIVTTTLQSLLDQSADGIPSSSRALISPSAATAKWADIVFGTIKV